MSFMSENFSEKPNKKSNRREFFECPFCKEIQAIKCDVGPKGLRQNGLYCYDCTELWVEPKIEVDNKM